MARLNIDLKLSDLEPTDRIEGYTADRLQVEDARIVELRRRIEKLENDYKWLSQMIYKNMPVVDLDNEKEEQA